MGGDAGRLIRVGQWLNHDGYENFEHAFVYLGGNMIIEAEPGGARLTGNHYKQGSVYWCTGIAKLWSTANRSKVLSVARGYKDVPYSAADYFAMAAHTLHLPSNSLLKDYVGDTGHMICSQLADQIASDCGTHIFTDGRWPGYVSPGGLWERDRKLL